MTSDRPDPVTAAFRATYAAIVDAAPFADDDVGRLADARPRRAAGGLAALAAAAVVLAAVGAVAWLAPGGGGPDVPVIGNQPFEPDVVTFLHTQASAETLADVRAAIDAHPAVGRVVFFSQSDAYAEAQLLFADDSELLDIITPEVLPPSFRFEAPPDAWPALAAELEAMDGVVKVVDRDEFRVERRGG